MYIQVQSHEIGKTFVHSAKSEKSVAEKLKYPKHMLSRYTQLTI